MSWFSRDVQPQGPLVGMAWVAIVTLGLSIVAALLSVVAAFLF